MNPSSGIAVGLQMVDLLVSEHDQKLKTQTAPQRTEQPAVESPRTIVLNTNFDESKLGEAAPVPNVVRSAIQKGGKKKVAPGRMTLQPQSLPL